MRSVSRLAGLVAATVLVAGPLGAQTCLGFSSLAMGGMNVTPAAHFYDGGKSYGAQLNFGHMGMGMDHIIGVFAQENTYDDVGGVSISSNTTFGANLGIQKKNSMGWEWCPQIGVDYTTGDTKVLGLDAVVGIGKALSNMGGFTPVPFAWGGFGYTKPDCTGCSSDSHGVYGAGLGFRMKNNVQVTPSFSKTTMSGDKSVFHVGVTITLGGKK